MYMQECVKTQKLTEYTTVLQEVYKSYKEGKTYFATLASIYHGIVYNLGLLGVRTEETVVHRTHLVFCIS